jgi:predicted nucleic acid-binding protein
MTRLLVVDASVATKWFVDEEDSDAAAALIEAYVLAAPELMAVELLNVMTSRLRAGSVTLAIVTGVARDLDRMNIQWRPDRALAAAALTHAVALRHPVYDCLYLALAIELECPVVTADRRFARAAARGGFGDLVTLLEDLVP